MAIPILALLACELDLALTAGALGLGLRRRHPAVTVLAAGAVAVAFAAAVFALWVLWFVAPACVIATAGCTGQGMFDQALVYAGAGALANWAFIAGVAMVVRRMRAGNAGTPGFRVAE